jgi:hypothetical protein
MESSKEVYNYVLALIVSYLKTYTTSRSTQRLDEHTLWACRGTTSSDDA